MRLLTHNLLACLRCEEFPLTVTGSVEYVATAFDEAFVRRMLHRIHYDVFLKGVAEYRTGFAMTLQGQAAAAGEGERAPSMTDVLVTVCDVSLTLQEVLESPLPSTSELLSTAIACGGVPEAADDDDGEVVFFSADPVQRHLMVLLHTLMECLVVRNGTLQCEACKSSYPVEDYIPSFVTSA